jgi:hypothetical protein
MKKEALDTVDSSQCEYSRMLMCRKSGIQLGLASGLSCRPLDKLAARQADQPKLQPGAEEICLKRELSRIFTEAERQAPRKV